MARVGTIGTLGEIPTSTPQLMKIRHHIQGMGTNGWIWRSYLCCSFQDSTVNEAAKVRLLASDGYRPGSLSRPRRSDVQISLF